MGKKNDKTKPEGGMSFTKVATCSPTPPEGSGRSSFPVTG